MSLHEFTEQQRNALIDMAILGMYADGHLALRENAMLKKILSTFGVTDETDQNTILDDAFVRIREYAGDKSATGAYLRDSAKNFGSQRDREIVQKMLQEMMSSDDKVTPEEERLLQAAVAYLKG